MSLPGNYNYFPPYESPLEDLFAYNLDKYLADGVSLKKQVEVQTFCGAYRLDFVADKDTYPSVAFECDGIDFHDESRDEWRDALILGESNLKAIYRFPGSVLHYHMEDCLYLLSHWEPHLFSTRGLSNLKRLASETATIAAKNLTFSGVLIIYPPNATRGPFLPRIARQVIEAPKDARSFLKTILKYAKSSGLTDLDKIRSQWSEGIGTERARAEYFGETDLPNDST